LLLLLVDAGEDLEMNGYEFFTPTFRGNWREKEIDGKGSSCFGFSEHANSRTTSPFLSKRLVRRLYLPSRELFKQMTVRVKMAPKEKELAGRLRKKLMRIKEYTLSMC
jgi:hypothetical protein